MGCELNKCCCFIDLRIGSLIIGYFSLVGTIIVTLLSICEVISLELYLGDISNYNPDEQENITTVGTITLSILTIVMIFQILNLIFVIILLVGLHKEKRGLVNTYLVANCIFIVFCIIMVIVTVLLGAEIRYIVRDLLSSGLGIYFLFVLRSYYLKMNDIAKMPLYNTA